MTATNLTAKLANLQDDETRCDLSDWAVNTLREAACLGTLRKSGGRCDRHDLAVLIREEAARISELGISLDDTGLVPYLRARRGGSRFRLSRNLRCAVFATVAARSAR